MEEFRQPSRRERADLIHTTSNTRLYYYDIAMNKNGLSKKVN